eukprot:Nitzschia sp. Nitz4//scaffold48_size128905//41196//42336//NITZ4_003590-RA/size128905-augustus-gene-0.3-mRNA-1//1//CDS//3329552952//7760//frame0
MTFKVSPSSILLFSVAFTLCWLYIAIPSNELVLIQHSNQQFPIPPPSYRYSTLQSFENQTLVFVHIGKTGGETIQWRIRLSCELRRGEMKRERCLAQFKNHEESILSKSTVGYLHCDRLRPKGILSDASMFLVSIRDPIHRIVSWFQYMHPRNCVPERPSGACNLKKQNPDWGGRFYENCFPDVNDFIREATARSPTECSALARETILGHGPEGPTNHLYYNYLHYANRTVKAFPNKPVMIIRQEAMWEDLRRIEQLLGGNPRRPFETEGPIITHGSEKFAYRARLDPTLIPALCCLLEDELTAYVQFVLAATNLEVREKFHTLQEFLGPCNATTVKRLRLQCGWTTATPTTP